MSQTASISDDFLDGVDEILDHLGKKFNERRIRYARETGALPIRMKPGLGLYAFRSELDAALRSPDSLPAAHKG